MIQVEVCLVLSAHVTCFILNDYFLFFIIINVKRKRREKNQQNHRVGHTHLLSAEPNCDLAAEW